MISARSLGSVLLDQQLSLLLFKITENSPPKGGLGLLGLAEPDCFRCHDWIAGHQALDLVAFMQAAATRPVRSSRSPRRVSSCPDHDAPLRAAGGTQILNSPLRDRLMPLQAGLELTLDEIPHAFLLPADALAMLQFFLFGVGVIHGGFPGHFQREAIGFLGGAQRRWVLAGDLARDLQCFFAQLCGRKARLTNPILAAVLPSKRRPVSP